MSDIKDFLKFRDKQAQENFEREYSEYMANLRAMLGDADNFELDSFLKSYVEAVWKLEKYCHSIAEYPVESVFHPNYDVYRVLGLEMLKTLLQDDGKIRDFVEYGLEKGIIRTRFAHLMLSNLASAVGDLQNAYEHAQKAHADYAHCGASYRTHYECWNACREAGLPVTEKFPLPEDLKNKFCRWPFEYLVVRNDAKEINLAPCQTSLWMSYAKTYSIDKFLEADVKPDFWNSPEFQEIRRSIHDGDFSYCSKLRCTRFMNLPNKNKVTDENLSEIIKNKQVVLDSGPKTIVLSYDETCNLACPSCRKHPIITSRELEAAYDAMADDFLLPSIDADTRCILLNASGEALASPHTTRFLKSLDFSRYPQLKIHLMTNGELLKSRLASIGEAANHIEKIIVSFDGITPETYEKIRRRGKFAKFMEGMKFAADMRKTGQINELVAVSTIFEDNYRELPGIYEFCAQNFFDHLAVNKFQNWGSYTADEFLQMDIWNSEHQSYAEWKKIFHELHDRAKNGKLIFSSTNMI